MKQKLIQLEQDNKDFFACGVCGGQGTNPETVKHLDTCIRNGYTKDDFMVDRNEFGIFIVCVNCGAHTAKGTKLNHHTGCKPGQSAMWGEHYDNAEDEEDEDILDAVADPEKEPFITVYKAIAGWKAQVVVWNDEEEFWEPWQPSFWAYGNPFEAERYAKDWAKDEDLKYVIPKDPQYIEEMKKYKEEHPDEA